MSLDVYMFLLIVLNESVYSEGMLAYILWVCVCEVQVNLSASYDSTARISVLSVPKDTMYKNRCESAPSP